MKDSPSYTADYIMDFIHTHVGCHTRLWENLDVDPFLCLCVRLCVCACLRDCMSERMRVSSAPLLSQ